MPIVLAYAEPPAAVAPAPPRPSVITAPDWLRKPTGQDMAEFYPKAAATARVEGRATIHCKVAETGSLTDCTASGEEPSGQGFGDAALRLSAYFKMRPMTRDGAPVSGGQINIPIRFMLPKQETPIPTLEGALECYGSVADKAEREPGNEEGQLALFGWRMIVEVLSVPEKLRPSELANRMSAAQQLGKSASGEANMACSQVMSSASIQKLQELVRAAPTSSFP